MVTVFIAKCGHCPHCLSHRQWYSQHNSRSLPTAFSHSATRGRRARPGATGAKPGPAGDWRAWTVSESAPPRIHRQPSQVRRGARRLRVVTTGRRRLGTAAAEAATDSDSEGTEARSPSAGAAGRSSGEGGPGRLLAPPLLANSLRAAVPCGGAVRRRGCRAVNQPTSTWPAPWPRRCRVRKPDAAAVSAGHGLNHIMV